MACSVLLASAKAQMLDLDLFRFLGIEPGAMKLLVVKSSVHFRAAFAPIASHILVAKAPGPMAADPGDLPWRRLAPGTARPALTARATGGLHFRPRHVPQRGRATPSRSLPPRTPCSS